MVEGDYGIISIRLNGVERCNTAHIPTATTSPTTAAATLGTTVFKNTELELETDINISTTGCPEKNAPQFLLNISGYKHPRRLRHILFER